MRKRDRHESKKVVRRAPVFISWSGDRSEKVAKALAATLEGVILGVQPWMSSANLARGVPWAEELLKQTRKCRCGVICLTKGNVGAPWPLFEAGALLSAYGHKLVCPYLIDDIELDKGPLSIFQWTAANEEQTLDLMKTINNTLPDWRIPDAQIEKNFKAHWPTLNGTLTAIRNGPQDPPTPAEVQHAKIEALLAITTKKVNDDGKLDLLLKIAEQILDRLPSDHAPTLTGNLLEKANPLGASGQTM